MSTAAIVKVPTLVGLGMEERTALLWKTMLEAPGAGVDELAEMLDLPESEVRDGLDLLAELALVRSSRQTPGLLVPVAAEAGLVMLLHRQEEELAAQRRQVEVHRDQITQALAVPHPDDRETSDEIEHLIGADVIQRRFEQLTYSTRECADTLMPGSAFPADLLEAARPLDTEVLRRGVRMRMIYQDSVRNDPTTFAYVRELADLGAEVRTAPVLPPRLFLCDRRIALVPLDPSAPQLGAACVTAPGVIASLTELFDYAWTNAVPLDVCSPVDTETGLTRTERELLTMLATGLTDETAAKRLGVSLRTVRRIMADLMNRLDAGSRFEAGIKAAKRGWL